jgi:hypothetical protein
MNTLLHQNRGGAPSEKTYQSLSGKELFNANTPKQIGGFYKTRK